MSGAELLAALWWFVPAYLANMTPVLVQGHLESWNRPMDGGRTMRGRRVLGDHKTWRGLVTGVVAGVLAYEAQRAALAHGFGIDLARFDYASHPVVPGLLLGFGALAGDAAKSFFKRQADIAPGESWFPFDQLDFLAGAWLIAAPLYAPPLATTIAIAPFVLAGGIVTTVIGWRLGLKEAWI